MKQCHAQEQKLTTKLFLVLTVFELPTPSGQANANQNKQE